MKTSMMSQNAPEAIGPYSQAVRCGHLVCVSGQLPIDPRTGKMPEGIRRQTEQSLANILAILQECGMTLDNVVKATVLLQDIRDFGAMNEVYREHFASPFPARCAYQVAALPAGALVEIEVMASDA